MKMCTGKICAGESVRSSPGVDSTYVHAKIPSGEAIRILIVNMTVLDPIFNLGQRT